MRRFRAHPVRAPAKLVVEDDTVKRSWKIRKESLTQSIDTLSNMEPGLVAEARTEPPQIGLGRPIRDRPTRLLCAPSGQPFWITAMSPLVGVLSRYTVSSPYFGVSSPSIKPPRARASRSSVRNWRRSELLALALPRILSIAAGNADSNSSTVIP